MGIINSILLIDDDNIFNLINKETVKKGNFADKVSSYSNAKKALDELKRLCESDGKDFPDILFLDINMPVMDGWEFLDEFEKFPEHFLQNCRVFLLTSSIDPSDIEKSKNYRTVKDFISKPLSKEILESLFLKTNLKY